MTQPNDSAGDDYRDSHRDSSKPAKYDPKFFNPKMTLGLMWQIERKIIGEIVAGTDTAPKRAQEFACGTGRILSRVEELVPECVGVDLSASMPEAALPGCDPHRGRPERRSRERYGPLQTHHVISLPPQRTGRTPARGARDSSGTHQKMGACSLRTSTDTRSVRPACVSAR